MKKAELSGGEEPGFFMASQMLPQLYLFLVKGSN